jgi:protein-arginine kinase activator protein McsA
MDCRLTCIYINQLHHYVEQLINDERYEEAAKVKLIIQKEEAAAHEIFGLNF